MPGTLGWMREAYDLRDNLRAQGVPLTIVPSAAGVSMWVEGADVDLNFRSWSLLESASTNPLIPTIETLVNRARRTK